MTREEFLELNPCIAKALKMKRVNHEDLLRQGEFLKTHTFIFKQLNPLEAKILKLRYGMADNAIYTQRQIATRLGVTASYIQQYERRAVLKLSTNRNIEMLMKYDDFSIGDRLIEKMINTKDYKRMMIQDIELALHEGYISVDNNIDISCFYIPSAFRSSIKQKLCTNGIYNVQNLVTYLQEYGNLKEFKIGDSTYTSVLFGISKAIEIGSVTIDNQELLDRYNSNKAKYLEHLKTNDLTDPVVFPELEKASRPIQQNSKHTQYREEAIEQAKKIFGEDLSIVPIDIGCFNSRVYNAFRRSGIDTIYKLINYYYDNNASFTQIRWVAKIGEKEILDKLESFGIELYAENFSR